MTYPELTLAETVDRLLASENPILLVHTRPDGDTVGSAAGLRALLIALGKDCVCLSPEKIPERLAFLSEGNGFYSPDGEGRLPAAIDLSVPHTVISVDVASPQQLGGLAGLCVGALSPSLMIDHHASGTPFAPRCLEADSAAVGEIIFGIAERMIEIGALKMIPPVAVAAIYAAVSSDSGCFMHGNTTPRTHRIAARLIELGADAEEINRQLFSSKSPETVAAEGYVAANVKRSEDGKIAWVAITIAARESLGLAEEYFETAIDIVRSLRGVEVAVTAKEIPGGKYKISLRSYGVNVAEVAARFGGGGHVQAAGCTVAADTPDAVIGTVVAAVKEGRPLS